MGVLCGRTRSASSGSTLARPLGRLWLCLCRPLLCDGVPRLSCEVVCLYSGLPMCSYQRRVHLMVVIRLGVGTGAVGYGVLLRVVLIPPGARGALVVGVGCWFPCLPLLCAG